jgi:hypothetical protein
MFKPTIKNNRNLQSQQVLNALIAVIRPYLPLDLQHTRIRADDIIAVLGYASANRISTDAACHELKGAPSANRLREVLAKALPDRIKLQRALNRILRAQTPRFVKKGKRSYYIAIDLTLIPYHANVMKMKKRSCALRRNQAQLIFTDMQRFPLCMTINAMFLLCVSWKKAKAWKKSSLGS